MSEKTTVDITMTIISSTYTNNHDYPQTVTYNTTLSADVPPAMAQKIFAKITPYGFNLSCVIREYGGGNYAFSAVHSNLTRNAKDVQTNPPEEYTETIDFCDF